MIPQESTNPAAVSANGARTSEQVAATLGLQATPSIAVFQVLAVAPLRTHGRFRTRLVRSGWVVVRRGDGLRKSIPVFRRRLAPIVRPGAHQ